MTRSRLWCCSTLAAIAVALVLPTLRAQELPSLTPPVAPVVLHIEPNVDLSDLAIHYMLADPLGSAFGDIEGRPSVRDFPVVARVDGRPARTLKGYAYLPGFGYGLISTELAAGAAARIITVTLRRLAPTLLAGRVTLDGARAATAGSAASGPPAAAAGQLTVIASYLPSWECEFFGLVECLVEPWPVASAPVAADGAFALDVPDFGRDPGLAGLRTRGEFDLKLVREGQLDQSGRVGMRVPVAASYEPVSLTAN